MKKYKVIVWNDDTNEELINEVFEENNKREVLKRLLYRPELANERWTDLTIEEEENKSNYNELLNSIKNTEKDKNYKPKNYKFGLKDFDEDGKEKR